MIPNFPVTNAALEPRADETESGERSNSSLLGHLPVECMSEWRISELLGDLEKVK
jgi:hypothetical protein